MISGHQKWTEKVDNKYVGALGKILLRKKITGVMSKWYNSQLPLTEVRNVAIKASKRKKILLREI